MCSSDLDQVEEVNRYATSGLEPNVTFFMDLDPEIGRSRIGKDVRDRLEQQKMDFHYRVYEGYKALAAKYPERIMRIDADRIEDLRNRIEKAQAAEQAVEKDMAAMAVWGEFDYANLDRLRDAGYEVTFFSCPASRYDEAWREAYNEIGRAHV